MADPPPGQGATQALPNLLAALSGSIATVPAGEAGMGSTAGDGADGRGRFPPIAAAPEAGSVTAAAGFAGVVGTAGLAVPSSAASSTAAEPTGAAAIADQVAGQLVRLVPSGSREMVMRLHPPELGDLTVRIAVSGRDVTAWFASPQPEVQTAISQAIGQLQTDLGHAGYNLNGAWVGADASGTGRQSAGTPLPTMPAAAGIAELPASGVVASRPLTSGMSIYV